MLKSFVVLLRFLLFWILFFVLERTIFVLFFTDKLKGIPVTDILKSYAYGLRLDASAAAYLCAVPLLIYIFLWFIPSIKLNTRIPKIGIGILIAFLSFLTILNCNIYMEWGSKVSLKVFELFFESPTEAIASSSSSPVILSFSIIFLFAFLGIFLANRIIDYRMPAQKVSIGGKLAVSILALGITFGLIRGGWQLSPINESMAYFSTKPILNHAALNTEWNLMHELVVKRDKGKNPFTYFEDKEARALVSDLYKRPAGNTTDILKDTSRVNVVLIVLESMTAEVVQSLGGEKGITPNIDKLASEGILFTNIYASGGRTDKGLMATLSGFPSQAVTSIMKDNTKQEQLPSLAGVFAGKGYATSFYYGGDSEFFNLKSYLLSHHYQKIIEKKDFHTRNMNSKWGAYDSFVFDRQLADLRTEKQPFFSTLLTLTNHEPFELPVAPRFAGEDVANKFRSTAFYTDSCLGAYFEKAKKQPWYDNTLFIVLADHGHRLPADRYDNWHPRRFNIPFLITGGALNPEFRGRRSDKTGSQTDLAATLFSQLGYDHSAFAWSKDLLHPKTNGFTFFSWDNGFAIGNDNQIISFDNVGRKIIQKSNAGNTAGDETLLKAGKAYMQRVYQTYLDY